MTKILQVKQNNNFQPKIKVALYCEFYHFFGGRLFRDNAMGFITSYKNQLKALVLAGIDFSEDLKNKDANILQCNAQGLRTLWFIKKFKKSGKKIIIYAHATAEELSGGFRFLGFVAPTYKRYLSYIYNLADIVICPSIYTKKLIEREYKVPKEKAVFISNGVDVHYFVFDKEKREVVRKSRAISEEQKIVMNAAMVIKKKGTEVFLKLAQKFPKVIFDWYGKKYSTLLASPIISKFSNLTFRGYVDDVVAAYSSADIFLFPSYEENQGIAVLEACSVGLPIIVRDIPAYSDWLADGINCLKSKSNDDFAQKLEQLLNNESLRNRLALQAHKMVVEEHSLEAVGLHLATLYKNLLSV